jgi:hypothetical protein
VPQVRVRIAWETPDGIWGISMVPCRLWDLHDNSGLFAKRSSPCRTPIAHEGVNHQPDTSGRADGRHLSISCRRDLISDGKLLIVPPNGLAWAVGVVQTWLRERS